MGSVALGLSFRFCSSPPVVLVCCHAFMVFGGKALAAIIASEWNSVEGGRSEFRSFCLRELESKALDMRIM